VLSVDGLLVVELADLIGLVSKTDDKFLDGGRITFGEGEKLVEEVRVAVEFGVLLDEAVHGGFG